MHLNEDGNYQEAQSSMSKSDYRKANKPIMEKRRRARINQSLNEIKTLILESMNRNPAHHTKLEKADILELAVKYLQNFQRQQLIVALATDPTALEKFKTGFNECATEIDRYINQSDGVHSTTKERVHDHLQNCIDGIEQSSQIGSHEFNKLPFFAGKNIFTFNNPPVEASSTGDHNNNPRIQIPQGIKLIPSRLPSGELAFLLPNSRDMSFDTAVNRIIPQRPSAFAAVIPQASVSESLTSKPLSPPMSPVNHDDLRANNPSPHGFRPVLPSKQRTYNDQVHQVSSTISSERQLSQSMDVKTVKYPIHKYPDKEKRCDSPKRFSEALSVITNQNERYRLAQMKEDSADYEENLVQRGIKRKFQEVSQQQGLLTLAQNDFYSQPTKIIKTQPPSPIQSFVKEVEKNTTSGTNNPSRDQPSCSKDNNSDMWRPW